MGTTPPAAGSNLVRTESNGPGDASGPADAPPTNAGPHLPPNIAPVDEDRFAFWTSGQPLGEQFLKLAQDEASFRSLYMCTPAREPWPTLQQLVTLEAIAEAGYQRSGRLPAGASAESYGSLYDAGWIDAPANGRVPAVLTRKGRGILRQCEGVDRRRFADESQSGGAL